MVTHVRNGDGNAMAVDKCVLEQGLTRERRLHDTTDKIRFRFILHT